jgi:uncharacterized membrane protein
VVSRYVVVADWLFTATTIIAQPTTGFYMIHLAGYPMHSRWIAWSLLLYLVAAACWVPVVWLQTRLRDLAREAAGTGADLPPVYWKYFRAWVILGVPAFFAFVAIFWLMVAKPV